MARPRRPDLHPRLIEFRRASGLTQEQVAERVGIERRDGQAPRARVWHIPLSCTASDTARCIERAKPISASAVVHRANGATDDDGC